MIGVIFELFLSEFGSYTFLAMTIPTQKGNTMDSLVTGELLCHQETDKMLPIGMSKDVRNETQWCQRILAHI